MDDASIPIIRMSDIPVAEETAGVSHDTVAPAHTSRSNKLNRPTLLDVRSKESIRSGDSSHATLVVGRKRNSSLSPQSPHSHSTLPLRRKRSRLAGAPTPTMAAHRNAPQDATSTSQRQSASRRVVSPLDILADVAIAIGPLPTGNSSSHLRLPPFSILEGLHAHPELLLHFASHLPIRELVSLYSIDRRFHHHMNANMTSYVMQAARNWAPEALYVFSFKHNTPLCTRDPTYNENSERPGENRDVPSLRWLQMLSFRERAVRDIITLLALQGQRLPVGASRVIQKIWLMMAVPNNATRVAMTHNRLFFSDDDLAIATLFFVKLDMRFPCADSVRHTGNTLPRILMAQKSLQLLWRTLRNEAMIDSVEVMQVLIRYNYEHPSNVPDLAGYSLLGVPANEIGTLQWEGWTNKLPRTKLMRPDEVIMREGVRRRLRLKDRYIEFMLFGFVNPVTGASIPRPKIRGPFPPF